MNWLRINESCLHDQRTKRQFALLDNFLAVCRQNSHVATVLFGIYLFETIVNRFSPML